jgi:integrase
MSQVLLDAAGRPRSPATLPGFHAGRPPRNKGRRYPADPPTIEEIVAVMRHAGDGVHGHRLRGLVVVLWRAGLRIHEALLLNEGDLDRRRGSLLVRRGKGGRRREVGMDEWAWEQLQPWLDARAELPVGPLFCIVTGPTRGRAWSNTAVRAQLRHVAAQAGVRRRFAPHQLRHAHAVEMAREGVPLIVIQRQLGHSSLGVTSIYLQGIDSAEIIDAVHARRAPISPSTRRYASELPVVVRSGSEPAVASAGGEPMLLFVRCGRAGVRPRRCSRRQTTLRRGG